MGSGVGAKSETRTKSRSDVPVQALSTFLAPRPSRRSVTSIVRKSMLQRVSWVRFGTVECKWAAENRMISANRHYKPNIRLQFDRLLGARLHPRITSYMASRIAPAVGIPAIVKQTP